eukprot:TRINITY_DN5691_c0_g1_i1.p1 TRINITY_DN5691_c0_g1~~TRINITY_DN5691_c0_g1_i1.p1  ORF type:complete len:326 (-),score=35.84 TRINITY_DN5691_c0_g1_i1:66-1043(-)
MASDLENNNDSVNSDNPISINSTIQDDSPTPEENLLPESFVSSKKHKRIILSFVRVFLYGIVYLAVLAPICYFVYDIPDTSLGNDHIFAYWFDSIEWSKLVLWLVCLFLGFTFVSWVTERRNNPFKSRSNTYAEILKLLLYGTFLFFIGPCRSLAGKSDPNPLSQSMAFIHNYFGFCFSYIFGIQYTYLDYMLFLRRVGDKCGTPSLWKTYSIHEALCLMPIISLILGLLVFHVYLLDINKLWIPYLVAYIIIIGGIALVSVVIRNKFYLHLHHWFIFSLLLPFTAFPNIISVICSGILAGIFTGGIARWDMGWLWYRGVRVYKL